MRKRKRRISCRKSRCLPAIFLICIPHHKQLSSCPSTASSSPSGVGSSHSTTPPMSCTQPCHCLPPSDLHSTSPSPTSHVDLRQGGAEEAKGPPPALDLPVRRLSHRGRRPRAEAGATGVGGGRAATRGGRRSGGWRWAEVGVAVGGGGWRWARP
jgi:hypothetical protein